MVAVRIDHQRSAKPSIAEARAAVEAGRDGLVDSLLAARPEEVRRLARRALDAERALFRRRGAVGPEPEYDAAAGTRAIEAYAEVVEARAGADRASQDAARWLTFGNLWGMAGLATAGGLVSQVGLSLVSAPVAAAITAAAAGPLASAVLGLVSRSSAGVRCTAAMAAWCDAVGATGLATLGAVHGRRLAHEAWDLRRLEAEAAAVVADEARAAWHDVAGPHRHPREAPALLVKMAALRAAQLQLLGLLIEEVERVRSDAAPVAGGSIFAVRSADENPETSSVVVSIAADGDTGSARTDGDGLRKPRARRLVFWTR